MMDNRESLLDVIDDTSDLFGNQNDLSGTFNWADEFLGDETADLSGSLILEPGNIVTSTNQSNLLPSHNFAVTSSIPAQNINVVTSPYLPTSASDGNYIQTHGTTMVVGHNIVNQVHALGLTNQLLQQGNQQLILKTASGQNITLSAQAQLQLLQQHQQNISISSPLQQTQHNTSQVLPILNRSGTPGASTSVVGLGYGSTPGTNTSVVGLGYGSTQGTNTSVVGLGYGSTPGTNTSVVGLGYGSTQGTNTSVVGLGYGSIPTSQNMAQIKSASPAPNVNLVHLPTNMQNQHQQHQQQFQLAPGTILQIPSASGNTQNLVGATLFQGHQLLNNNQQGSLVNAHNTVIQNPNVVNVNVAAQQVLCNNPQQQNTLGLTTHSPFNIQGTLIQTAEGKSILIPSHNFGQPINIQGLSVTTPVALQQTQVQQPTSHNTVASIMQLTQQPQSSLAMDNRSNQGLQQFVLNHQGQQILVQRATSNVRNQPQNIILHTTGGQPSVLHLQQRQPSQVPNAQQTLQALTSGSQQFKIINQQNNSQSSLPVTNIGGQNVTLQQLTGQLGNLQGLQLVQQSQGQISFQGQGQINIQGQQIQFGVQQQNQNNDGNMMFQQSNVIHDQGQMNSGSFTLTQQPAVIRCGSSVSNAADTSSDSAENQTRLILQQINDSLKKSNTFNSGNSVQKMSQVTTNVQIKQEHPPSADMSTNALSQPFTPSALKSETNLIESFIKQEPGITYGSVCSLPTVKQSDDGFNTNSAHNVTSLSQGSTHMSQLSNGSQNLLGNTVTTSSGYLYPSIMSTSNPGNTSLTDVNTIMSTSNPGNTSLTDVNISELTSQQNIQQSRTLQTIEIPPELRKQLQRVQLEIQKVTASTSLTPQQKQSKIQQYQIIQKSILLKGRVLATTRGETHLLEEVPADISHTRSSQQSECSTSVHSFVPAQSVQSSSSKTSLSCTQPCSDPQEQHAMSQCHMFAQVNSQSAQTKPDITNNLGQIGSINRSGSESTLSALLSSQKSSISNNNLPLSSFVSSQHNPPDVQVSATSSQQNNFLLKVAASTQQLSPAIGSSNVHMSTTSTQQHHPSQSIDQQICVQTSAVTDIPQVAVPTQIKIADKVLTLSLTPAQKEKVQSYLDKMTPEQQEQYLQTQQHVLQRIQKQQQLNAQIRAQVEAQKKQAALASTSQEQSLRPTIPKTLQPLKAECTSSLEHSGVKVELKEIPVPNPNINIETITNTVTRGQKRSYMDIPKGTLINQQIKQDQNHALKPDTKRPFRSRGEACRRLLRYHVFQSYGSSEEEIHKFDKHMDMYCGDLIRRKHSMFERFRHLLVQETMRLQPSSELVMLQRMQNQDLRKVLEEEKLQVKNDPDSFEPMPTTYMCQDANKDSDTLNSDIKIESVAGGDGLDNESVKSEMIEVGDTCERRQGKVRKLVIKADGFHFKSSFKRQSLDNTGSIKDENELEMKENIDHKSDLCDIENGALKTELSETSEDNITDELVNEDDSFINQTFTVQNETEKALLSISSADETEFNELGTGVDFFSSNRQCSSGAHCLPGTNFEMTSESVYLNNMDCSHMKHSGNYSNTDGNSPENCSLSDHDNTVDSSDIEMEDGDESNVLDNYGMYQPITESLTDSEENSYFSVDHSADKNTVLVDENSDVDDSDDENSNAWGKTRSHHQSVNDSNQDPKCHHQSVSDSNQEPDLEVKAQVENAINSILSLDHGVSGKSRTVYNFNQANQLYQAGNHTNSTYADSRNMQPGLHYLNEQLQTSSAMNVDDDNDDDTYGSDLDAAVNSILM